MGGYRETNVAVISQIDSSSTRCATPFRFVSLTLTLNLYVCTIVNLDDEG